MLKYELTEQYTMHSTKETAVYGICGSKTVTILSAFQKSCKITSDGMAGADTYKKIFKANGLI